MLKPGFLKIGSERLKKMVSTWKAASDSIVVEIKLIGTEHMHSVVSNRSMGS